jgi:hypothetical protein
MRFQNFPGLVELDELELKQVFGGLRPPFDMDFRDPGKRGEVHGSFSGPPMKGEIGGGYSLPNGGRIGGSISSDGRDWMAGISGAMTSRSGNTILSGSAHTDGHDWQVNGSVLIRF